MKYILTFFCAILGAVSCAASTCETRVDDHQKATTRQRVAYCLTEEPQTAASGGPELVYSGVYSKTPEKEQKTKSTVRDGYFNENKVSVKHNYVGSGAFPAFTNDTLSEQDRAALEQQYLTELAEQRAAASVSSQPQTNVQSTSAQVVQPVAETVASTSKNATNTAQNKQGLKARQSKPKRIMKMIVKEEESETVVAQSAQPEKTEADAETENLMTTASPEEDDLLNSELGVEDDMIAAPIPAPTYQQQ